jgi:hypothetical protein
LTLVGEYNNMNLMLVAYWAEVGISIAVAVYLVIVFIDYLIERLSK